MSWPGAMRRGRAGATMGLVNVTFDDLVAGVRRILSGPDGPIALALALGLGTVVETLVYAADPGDRASGLIVNLLATLALVFWRTRLPWVAGVVTFASLVAVGSNPTLLTLSGITAQLIVVYLVANRYRRRWSVLLAAPFLVAAVAWSDEDSLAGVMLLVLVVAAQVLGDSRRQRSQAIAERDATRHAMAETQRDQAVMEERARIARELHDVVAHHVSVIAVQAETARLTTPDLPEEGKERLAAIGQTARDSLTELRRLLGILRSDGVEPARSPQPGLARLEELVASARTAGTTVRLTLSGEVVSLPPGVDLTAYRIVQEALTNARRHAPGAAVDVEIGYEAERLRLRVSDDGPGPPTSDTSGHGLMGMHERAAMVGGTLRTGAGPSGGFLVEADLPISRVAP
jgi:signal transduction histidine kinase